MRWLVVMVAASALASACLAGPGARDREDAPDRGANLWEQGLAEFYDTPPHVLVREAAKRGANVAPPGDPGYAAFDAAMRAFMQEQGVPAGQFVFLQNGRVAYASGYGYTKADGSAPTTTNTMFRIASVTKPMTHALLGLQVDEGLYNWTDPVFCLPPEPAPNCRIPLAPHPNRPVVDERIGEITVAQLLSHQAGWTRADGDHLYRAAGTQQIQASLGTTGAPSRWQAALYLMGSQLTYKPGTATSYCNMCYALASLVAEAATGASIGALFEAYLFRPLGVTGDIELGKAFPEDRNPREPFYDTTYERPSAYDPNKTVRAPDGGFNIEMLAATGGLVSTAAAVAAVYEAYPERVPTSSFVRVGSRGPYDPQLRARAHGGLLDGTLAFSVWAQDTAGPGGTFQFAYLFNDGSPASSCRGMDLPTGDSLEGCAVLALQNELLNLAVTKARQRALV